MILRCFRILSILLALLGPAHAQLAATLNVRKKQFLAGEPVLAVVTVTNRAGKDLTFASDGRTQWLDFIITDGQGNSVTPRGNTMFGKMTIKAGESLAREVGYTHHASGGSRRVAGKPRRQPEQPGHPLASAARDAGTVAAVIARRGHYAALSSIPSFTA